MPYLSLKSVRALLNSEIALAAVEIFFFCSKNRRSKSSWLYIDMGKSWQTSFEQYWHLGARGDVVSSVRLALIIPVSNDSSENKSLFSSKISTFHGFARTSNY